MNNQDFTSTIWVEQTPEEVYKTILNARSWWSGLFEETFEGDTQKPGDEFSFRAGGGMHQTHQKLVELVPNKKIVWLVTEANLSFASKTDEWKGTKISFEITADAGRTKVLFTHIGLVPDFECYHACAPAWTQYIQEQLPKAINAAGK